MTAGGRQIGVAALVLFLLVAGCSDSQPDSLEPDTALEIKEMQFSRSEIRAAAARPLSITVSNGDDTTHTFSVLLDDRADQPLAGTGEIAPGSVGHVTILLGQPGEYVFICDLHPDKMTGIILVE